MKKVSRRLIQVALLAILVFSLYKIFDYYQKSGDYRAQTQDYQKQKDALVKKFEEAKGQEKSKEDMEVEAGQALVMDLHRSYPQVLGRLLIKNTSIDFPFVQGEDNEYYLDHTYKKEAHPFGAIFMDARNAPDFTDQNTVLYGHNVRSGHVFHDLDKFRDQAFVEKSPYIILDTLGGRKRYKIFAAYEASAYEDYRSPNYSQEDWAKFLGRIKEKNHLSLAPPQGDFKMLTLSTCSDLDDRYVIHGYLVED